MTIDLCYLYSENSKYAVVLQCPEYFVLFYQVGEAFPRVAELHKHVVGKLDELKVVEGENLLDFDLVIFVLVSSFDKVLHKMADKCKLLSY